VLTAGYPLAQTSQSNILSSYDQTIQAKANVGMVQEHGVRYQLETMNQGMVPETPPPLQVLMSNASLENIMRQAQVGLFALPNKEEYS